MTGIRNLQIGDRASRRKRISDADVRAFAAISGDTNSVHLDDEAAARSVFGRRVVHGMLTASLISSVLGNDLPGPGTGMTTRVIGGSCRGRTRGRRVRRARPTS